MVCKSEERKVWTFNTKKELPPGSHKREQESKILLCDQHDSLYFDTTSGLPCRPMAVEAAETNKVEHCKLTMVLTWIYN